MMIDILDNETRKTIVLALKKNGRLSVDDLSREVKITPMGVRQHLIVLERCGIVEHIIKSGKVGRPGFRYKLTKEGEDLFPKVYAEFSLAVLRNIEETDGKGRVDELLKKRKDALFAEKAKRFSGSNGNLSHRISTLIEMLREDGGIVELEETDNHFRIMQYHCPLLDIALAYRETCNYDLLLLRELLGVSVAQQQWIADGAQSCIYVIPKQ